MKTNPETVEYIRRFGTRVRLLRQERGLSQEELAERVDVHRTFIGMIERGEKNATLVTIVKISGGLEVSVAELLRGLENA